MWWASILPILGFLGLSVLELGRGTRQTDSQTAGQTDTAHHFIRKSGHNKIYSIYHIMSYHIICNTWHRALGKFPPNSFLFTTCRYCYSNSVYYNNNSSYITKLIYLNWRFGLNQRPSSEEAVLSSSGSWHDGKMSCQESGRRRDWVGSCPRPDS